MSLPKSTTEVEVEVKTIEASLPHAEEPSVDLKTLLRRIDLKVLPMLFVIYVAAFLDR